VSDPQDGRACMVSLSVEGVALVDHLKASRGKWFRLMLQDWEPADAEAFGDYLERFAASFEVSKTTPFDASKTAPIEVSQTIPPEVPKTTPTEVSK
jgi:hypothetical protein